MKTLQDQYKLIKEGKGHKGVFLNEAKRMFPNYIPNHATFENAADVLKHKGIISENIVGIEPINSLSRPKESYEEKFAKFLEEARKKKDNDPNAEIKKVSQQVEDKLKHNFDRTDKKNPDNQIFGEIMKGYYCEMKNPKNADKTEQQLRDIVLKNLAKDPIYYTKNGMFGEEGVGVELEVPGLGSPKEPKGKYKSSGYGTLKEGIESRYSKDDVWSIVDYHEKTGMLPKGMDAEEFDQLKAQYGIEVDREDFTDPAGGSGLYSHLEETISDEDIVSKYNEMMESNPSTTFEDVSKKLGIDISRVEKALYEEFLQEQQLRKVIRESIEKELAAINKEAESEVLNLKLEKIQTAIDKRNNQLSKLDEDEDMKALTDKKKLKQLQKDIKTLEKAKTKIEKQLSKVNKKKGATSTKKEVIDEDAIDEADINEAPATQDLEKGVESAEAIKQALDDASKIELEENQPEEAYLVAKEEAEERVNNGEEITTVIKDYPEFKDMLFQDLKGKFEGSDY